MLTIRNLQVEYKKESPVLKGINLSMEPGKIHGLVGLNGAGKTTLLNTLYAFIRPSEGSVLYNDTALKRKDIAYLEAENYFYPYMTGREYLNLFPAGKNGFDTESWQQLFHIPLDDITENYSTGMRKKLALLAVLKPDKPILILDEPFNGLDLESAHILTLILQQLREGGKTVLVTSHVFETLTSSCDQIHHIDHGTIDHSYSKEQFGMLQELLYSTIENRASDQIRKLI
ncbi:MULTISPECIES: ATP-binding cassette domain-containing protein [Parabacteroides]|uniref:ABC transporter ATP-binding protein n=1 Tax=Parabacteroides TaxID=375288 RepID=UPI00240E640A|nr:ATP-binding cassette domain-containing protein [Parabacteroides chongii]WFE86249.1 ATP-binding cassette domain-containing protein [Parabacteroides chongii]